MDNTNTGLKLFVLDTNILMHDPTAIYHFDEHDIYLPMVVLEELDSHKTGTSELARNVRQTNRMLVELMSNATHDQIVSGLPIPSYINSSNKKCSGRLFFQTDEFDQVVPSTLPGHKVDNTILATALGLQKKYYGKRQVIIISKDINLRIKAGILGIHAEDYYNDQVLDDVNLLHRGLHILDNNFWDSHAKDMGSWQESGKTFYKVSGPLVSQWNPNDCLSTEDDQFQALVKKIDGPNAVVQLIRDYTQPKHSVWGITARNREQNFSLNLLLDPDIDFVSLQGSAGTGKTLLTIAAGLTQVMDQNRYSEILMTRVTIPVGEDIGFLPGTEEEKMTPWMGALMDNLEVLHSSQVGGSFGRGATQDLLQNKIKIRSLNFMRGRTFLNRYIIIDEAQNLTSKQIKTLVTRAGPGSKIICLGDIKQIDTPYLTETTSGLTFAVDRFKSWEHSAHMTLTRGERSRLAFYAAEHL
ncbi:TPA: PhoH family protein [Legionella pneumophila]|uniref:PhoH protein (Phosphate starvation inducible protein) n=4 Tax=Legionella pneumophila TaxID=446 RepID=Q5ZRN8_LEGPH|nr:PhoH family protein [Legionella pneumophila]AAU28890.1 PhoH protein (phosphate starvation inducible protein) [Legionella pneumophila subsp. pneumophila str. Philadelphia 1]AEW53065.1 PhoH protein (phosphate starvation inducible protein) [Legionella pneumophila subsp. pneumophila ATCC 43290]AGH52277.1 putative ATPase related to phosphate starvation-inducible protein PhoH [Legionella pneumophila subsp. pneumophila LPE509]AGN15753.1 phosphate starvation-inducible protein PhoH [Legionella pneumo